MKSYCPPDKNKKHRKSKLNQADHLACQLNLFVTNIPKGDCTANEIYQLYKIRWQIELIFKTWKSVLKYRQDKNHEYRTIQVLYVKQVAMDHVELGDMPITPSNNLAR